MAAIALPSLTVAPRAVRACAAQRSARSSRAVKVVAKAEKQVVSAPVREQALSAATAAAVLSAQPAFAGDLFADPGVLAGGALFIGGGVVVISALLLPFITGTLNPIQMAVNLGIVEGEISNERKFKNNGEPMEHGTKFGHVWYDTSAFVNGKDIDFAGVSKTVEAQEKTAK